MMKRRMIATAVVMLLFLGAALTASAQKPMTIEVVIGENATVSPSKFRVPVGALVRLVVINHSNAVHGLVSNLTEDAIYTKPGETKTLEFKVSELPITFACKIPGHTEKFTLETGQGK